MKLTVGRLRKIIETMQDTAIVRFADNYGQHIDIEDDWEFSSPDDGLLTLFEEEPEVEDIVPPGHQMTARERVVMIRSLLIAWNYVPEMRFLQMIMNAIHNGYKFDERPIPFYVEDERLITRLGDFITEMLNQGDGKHIIDLRTLGSDRHLGTGGTNHLSPNEGVTSDEGNPAAGI